MCFLPPICVFCRHYRPEAVGDQRDCAAFAEIPEVIFRGDLDHREPFPDDGGIRFELDPGQEADFEEFLEIRRQFNEQELLALASASPRR